MFVLAQHCKKIEEILLDIKKTFMKIKCNFLFTHDSGNSFLIVKNVADKKHSEISGANRFLKLIEVYFPKFTESIDALLFQKSFCKPIKPIPSFFKIMISYCPNGV